jgi:hypothetical protein
VNLHGAGATSSILSALAAQKPDPPAAPATTQIATGVKVQWAVPVENHQSVLEYEIAIADSLGAYASSAALCDGSNSISMSN